MGFYFLSTVLRINIILSRKWEGGVLDNVERTKQKSENINKKKITTNTFVNQKLVKVKDNFVPESLALMAHQVKPFRTGKHSKKISLKEFSFCYTLTACLASAM